MNEQGLLTPIYILNFDGACEPKNPGGHMTSSWILYVGDDVERGAEFVPAAAENTNNRAEWGALHAGLLAVQKRAAARKEYPTLFIRGDSKLVIEQLNGRWKCKSPEMASWRDKCLAVLKTIDNLTPDWIAEWVPREENAEADGLGRQRYLAEVGKHMPERGRKSA